MAHASGTKPQVRIVKSGEIVAIKPDALRSGEQSGRRCMWWDLGTEIKENELIDGVSVVHVRGSLEHHPDYASDSYDQIRERVREACGCEESTVIVLRLDSPGGVVSGLNELVGDIRALGVEFGKPLIAYVDEMAASAAYAIACACEEIYLPRSAICGSVGVISTLHDQVKADERVGLNFVTITSGARKSDGHPHVAISDDAIAAETRRVDKMARQFFKLVAQARPLSVGEIEGLEAGIFLGKEAVKAGLADDVMSWGALLEALKALDTGGTRGSASSVAHDGTPATKGNETDRRADPPLRKGSAMLTGLKAQLKRAQGELAKAKNSALKSSLKDQIKALEQAIATTAATLEAKKKIKHKEVTHEEESDDEGDADDEEDEEESEEEADAPTDKKKSKKSKHADGDGDDDDGDDDDSDGDDDSEDEEEEESEEEEKYGEEEDKKAAKAIVALATKATGKKGRAAIGALAAILAEAQNATKRLAVMERQRIGERKTAMIDKAKSARRITPHEAKVLRKKPLSFVESFLEMRPKALIHTDDAELFVPKVDARGNSVDLPADVSAEIEKAIASANYTGERAEKLRKEMIEAHAKRLNGAAEGRY